MSDESADQGGQRPEPPSGWIDEACSRFETAWQTGQQPRIEEFLRAESPGKNRATLLNLLVQLVGIDLEWRWKTAPMPAETQSFAGLEGFPDVSESSLLLPRRPRLADYVARYSLLGPVQQLPKDLIVNEYYARRRYGDRPTHTEYLDVFGSRHPDLAKQLQAIDGRMVSAATSERPSGDGKPAAPRKEGSLLGHYRILRTLGGGGMGCVYLAHDEELDKEVAVKVPHRHLFRTEEELQRFLAEARTAAKLKHANIVPIHYFGRESGGTCYIVMDYIDGPSLAERLRSGPLPPEQAAAILATVADAVGLIHKKGFVHRDLKPANILLDAEGRPQVADFGLALHESAQRRLAGDNSGTLAYMPPEQVEGKAQWLDGRADIWALGVIFYEMLTGRKPFQGETFKELKQEILHRDPKPPRQINITIPVPLESVCLKCLSKNTAHRFATAGDLANKLREHKSTGLHPGSRTKDATPYDGSAPRGRSAFAKLNFGKVGCSVSVAFSLLIAFGIAVTWHVIREKRMALVYEEAGRAAADSDDSRKASEAEATLAKAELFSKAIQAQACYNRGLACDGRGDFDKAITAYTEAIRLDPKLAVVYVDRGGALTEKSNFRAAVEDFEKAVSLEPHNVEAFLGRAAANEGLGRRENALADYGGVIALCPQDARAYERRACLHEQMGNLVTAISDYEQAIDKSRDDNGRLRRLKRRARAYVLTGDLDNGIKDYTAALLIRMDADSLGGRGIARARNGQYREALEDLRKAIDMGGGTAEVYYCRGCVYLAAVRERPVAVEIPPALDLRETIGKVLPDGKPSAVPPTFTPARKQVRLSSVIRLASVTCLFCQNPKPELLELIPSSDESDRVVRTAELALADFNIALRIRPQYADAFLGRGIAKRLLGRLEEAVGDISAAIDLDGKLAEAYRQRAFVRLRLDRFHEAIHDADEAIRQNRDDVAAYSIRAAARAQTGDLDGALSDYEEAIRRKPADLDLHYNRGVIFLSKNDYDRAIDDFREMTRLAPKDALGFRLLAKAQMRKMGRLFDPLRYGTARPPKDDLRAEQVSRAIENLNKAIRLDGQNADSFYYRALEKLEQAQLKLAIEDLDRAIELRPKEGKYYFERGGARLNSSDNRRAAADLEKALRLEPVAKYVPYCHRCLGVAYERMGDVGKSRDHFQKAGGASLPRGERQLGFRNLSYPIIEDVPPWPAPRDRVRKNRRGHRPAKSHQRAVARIRSAAVRPKVLTRTN